MKYFLLGGILLFVLTCFRSTTHAQIGGKHTFQFMSLSTSPRVASMGGKLVSVQDDDLSLPYYNPSLLNASMHQHLSLNFIHYFAGINYGYASYARDYKNIGTFSGGIHFIDYGTFTRARATGEKTGKFYASEYMFHASWSRKINKLFSVGASFKPILSFLDRYFSLGLAADIGMTYQHPQKSFTGGLVVKNIGTQIVSYNQNIYEPIPLEIMIGGTFKFEHAPFRISLTGHQLQNFDLRYEESSDDTEDPFGATDQEEDPGTLNQFTTTVENIGDEILRHLVFGVEMPIIEDDFYVRAGYNYKRRQEMKISPKVGMVGFSWGFGLRIYKFHFSYGRATYHLAGPSNHFSVTTNLSSLYSNKPKSSQ